MSTQDNLYAAFSGESQANRKYLAFAQKAEKEGFKGVAKLFRAVAAAETIHALNYLKIIGDVRSTTEILKTAIDGEVYENMEMYPGFIEIAKKDGNNEAVVSFDHANKVEKIHETMFKQALKIMDEEKDIEEKDYFVCQVCGYTAEGESPDTCPVCGASKEKFKKTD